MRMIRPCDHRTRRSPHEGTIGQAALQSLRGDADGCTHRGARRRARRRARRGARRSAREPGGARAERLGQVEVLEEAELREQARELAEEDAGRVGAPARSRGRSEAIRREQERSEAIIRTCTWRGQPRAIDGNGNQWQSMAINGNQWQPMATNGNQWQSMAISSNRHLARARGEGGLALGGRQLAVDEEEDLPIEEAIRHAIREASGRCL